MCVRALARSLIFGHCAKTGFMGAPTAEYGSLLQGTYRFLAWQKYQINKSARGALAGSQRITNTKKELEMGLGCELKYSKVD